MGFTKATKKQAKARVALIGPPGSGKTWTALTFAKAFGGRTALIDTENASASKYADSFDFDTLTLSDFNPQNYINAIHEAEAAGYDNLIIDSVSHAWSGTGGILQIVDNATARAKSGNAFSTGWREATPIHNKLVDALVQCKCHLFITIRSKVEYVLEDHNGKKVPRKVGMAPVQREGLEYEFDVVGDMDWEHKLVITKSRCSALADVVVSKPGIEIAQTLAKWLGDGVSAPAEKAPPADDAALSERHQIISGALASLKQRFGTDQVSAKSAITEAFGCGWKQVTELDVNALRAGALKLHDIINGALAQ